MFVKISFPIFSSIIIFFSEIELLVNYNNIKIIKEILEKIIFFIYLIGGELIFPNGIILIENNKFSSGFKSPSV